MINENKQFLDEWINQHLEERERRLSGNNPFVWHQPNANDLLPSSKLECVAHTSASSNADVPIEFTKE